MQLLTRRTARTLVGNQRLQRWCFDVELIYVAQKLGIPIAEVPVNWTEIPGEHLLTASGILAVALRFLGKVQSQMLCLSPCVHHPLKDNHGTKLWCPAQLRH